MWANKVLAGSGGFETNAYALKRIEYNTRVAKFESDLLDLPTTGETGPYGVSIPPLPLLSSIEVNRADVK